MKSSRQSEQRVPGLDRGLSTGVPRGGDVTTCV